MYIDSVNRGDEIITWSRSFDGSLSKIVSPAPYYYYEESDEPSDIHSIFGAPVKKVEFESRDLYNMGKGLAPLGKIHESDISPLYKFLSDNFHNLQNKNLNIGYFDIEVDFDLNDGIGYPTPQNPYGEINSVSLFDANTQIYHMVVLLEDGVHIRLQDDDFNVIVHECVTERQLLDKFFNLIEDIDILSAWNGDNYDIPYIMIRAMKIYGRAQGLKKLCRDGFSAKERMIEDAYGNEIINFQIFGRVHLDMMKVYKNSTFGERQSYSLNFISEYEEIGSKIDYKGDLGELYRTDPQRFFEYSLHDARLMKDLDRKMKIIELSIIRAQASTILYTDIYGSIKPLEMKIRNYVHHTREHEMALPDKEDHDKEPFEGAFVVATKPSIYGWSTSVDLEGLYPTVMRTINVSPETHLFQLEDNEHDFIKVVERSEDMVEVRDIRTGQVITTKAIEVSNLIRTNNLTISAFGSIFAEEEGLISEVLNIWVAARKSAKNKMFEITDKRNDVKANGASEEELHDLAEEIAFYNSKQLLAKLDNNSLYGVLSNRFSRLYTIYCAASITLTGQIIEKHQIYTGDRMLQELDDAR